MCSADQLDIYLECLTAQVISCATFFFLVSFFPFVLYWVPYSFWVYTVILFQEVLCSLVIYTSSSCPYAGTCDFSDLAMGSSNVSGLRLSSELLEHSGVHMANPNMNLSQPTSQQRHNSSDGIVTLEWHCGCIL